MLCKYYCHLAKLKKSINACRSSAMLDKTDFRIKAHILLSTLDDW